MQPLGTGFFHPAQRVPWSRPGCGRTRAAPLLGRTPAASFGPLQMRLPRTLRTALCVSWSFLSRDQCLREQLLGPRAGAVCAFIRNGQTALQDGSNHFLRQYLVKPHPVMEVEL